MDTILKNKINWLCVGIENVLGSSCKMPKTLVIYSCQGRYKKDELKYIESSCGFKNYFEKDVY